MKESNNFGCKGELLLFSKVNYSGKVFSNCESTGWGMDSKGLRFSSTGELGSLFLSYVRDMVKRYL